jgi:outer membrane protein OmpA-like peptidoglycan-associated protein
MNRAVLAFAALALTAGCVPPSKPPSELVDARAAMARARHSPLADRATVELADAEHALSEAEYEALRHPRDGSARDLAYVARREADRVRVVGLYNADVEALQSARGSVERLRTNIARSRAQQAELERAVDEARSARDLQRTRLSSSLDRLGTIASSIAPRDGGGVVLRVDWPQLFIAGSSLLRAGASSKLDAIADALKQGPPCDLRLQVLDDLEPLGHDTAKRLAERRVQRLREALVARGVLPDAILPPERWSKPGTQIDLVLTERAGATSNPVPSVLAGVPEDVRVH